MLEEASDIQLNRMKSHFDQQDKKSGELTDKLRATKQRLANLQYEARQSRLATKADVEPDAKTRKCAEDAATDRVKNGDSSFARADDGPTRLASFGIIQWGAHKSAGTCPELRPALSRATGARRIVPEERHDRRSSGTIRIVRCRSALCGANRAQIEYETVE